MTVFSFINLTVKGPGKNRFPGLLVAAGFLICVMMLPARAEKVADGTVNFTGSMLGGSTCTLVNPALALDFGTLSVDRGGGIPANPLVPFQTRTFQLTNCASSVRHVDMTVTFYEAIDGNNTHIMNNGSSVNVAGILTCPADAVAQGENCTAGSRFSDGEMVTGTVNNGTVKFPLSVSLVSFDLFNPLSPDIPAAGGISMTVSFTFEEA
ncbi:type 1 fimbrial protein [Salmonella enterica subsp. enterica serovar Bredeney]|nr:type 1 fimbrial protein [Salmonella enterica subsp. enterica serovar Bredeney]